jgi:histidinol-phosphatase (PHP family)
MSLATSYHNHTTWSDGETSLAEQIAGAKAAGLLELGMSDHYTVSPTEIVEWSMPLERLGDYVQELSEAKASTTGLIVRIGVEADYFPETVRELDERLLQQPFDYVIGSVHYVNGFPLDETKELWDALSADEVNEVWRGYWDRIVGLANSGAYDFVGHIDLPKKFGVFPTESQFEYEEAALNAVAAAGMAIEINTAGWYKPANEAYPTLDILRRANNKNIPLLINADAHHPDHLTRDFDKARTLALDAGYSSVVRYESRRTTSHAI